MKTLVFIRGWASLDYTFKKFLASKPDDWEVIIIAADKLLEDFNIDHAADKLHKIIAEKKISKFVLAGHSLGGAVAIAYAAKYPQIHSQVIIINPVGSPISESIIPYSLKMVFRNSIKNSQEWPIKIREGINLLKNPFFNTKLGKFAKELDILSQASQVNKPVLILFGDQDKLVPLKTAQDIKNAINNSKLQILKNHNHDWITFYPEKFWEILNSQDKNTFQI